MSKLRTSRTRGRSIKLHVHAYRFIAIRALCTLLRSRRRGVDGFDRPGRPQVETIEGRPYRRFPRRYGSRGADDFKFKSRRLEISRSKRSANEAKVKTRVSSTPVRPCIHVVRFDARMNAFFPSPCPRGKTSREEVREKRYGKTIRAAVQVATRKSKK